MVNAKDLLEFSKPLEVLYVEDDAMLRESTTRLLATFFGRIVTAENGEKGLATYQADQFDLVITDIRMPEMDGIEMSRRIKALNLEQPIVVISAHDESAYLQELINEGVDYFLSKPLDVQKFLPTMLKVCKNIAAKKEADQAREKERQYTEQLRQLNADKDKFFSIISHDLKGPFNGLLGMAELLKQQARSMDAEAISEFAENIHESAQKFYKLLQNLLDWSRLQLGKMEIAPEALPLAEVVQESLDVLANLAQSKNIRLENQIPVPVQAWADRRMLQTVVHNLVSNAIKFTHPEGWVRVAVQARDNFWEISVEDNGTGMSPEDLTKLFRIDVHFTNPGTAEESGTGLGLNLCKEMVEKNRGQIGVTSSVGQGSRFWFTLPQFT